MIWEDFRGTSARGRAGASCRTSRTRPRTCSRAHGVERGRPGRGRAAADARDRGDLLRHLEARRDPALDVGALRRRRDRAPAHGLASRRCSSPTRPTPTGCRRDLVDARDRARRRAARRTLDDRFETVDTAADDPAQLYYTSGTTGLAKGIVHAHRYILAHEEFVYCHEVAGRRALPRDGRVGLGGGHRAAARPLAARRGAVRLPARGRLRPARAARLPLPARGHERLHDADGDALDDGDRGRRRRATRRSSAVVCSAGEPLNPEAIRWFREQYGVTVLDYYGLTESYPLVRATSRSWRCARARWASRCRAGTCRSSTRTSSPVAPGERGEICLRARSNPHYPLGYWNNPEAARGDLRRRVVPHQGRRRAGRGRLRLVRGPRRRRDHLGRLPDRPVRGRVGLPRAPGGRARRPPSPRPTSAAATSSRRSSCSPRATSPPTSSPTRSRRFVRERLSRLRLPAPDRVRRRAAEDADRQDPPDRAARG